jgi:NAD(P)-dependent dehydrogenase (short-subunit alcohol dehydrogenase family)
LLVAVRAASFTKQETIMKIILVGASGTIGKAVDKVLSASPAKHDIVRVSRSHGDFPVDITDPRSISALYTKIGPFDAVVSTTGDVHFGPLVEFTQEQFEVGLRSKLMGQVNLVILGLKHIRDGGSFTLITGQINEDPIRYGASGALVNAGVEGFVRSAAIEMPRGVRINAVSPTVTEEALSAFGPFFPGQKPIPAAEAAGGFLKSVEGPQTGHVYRIGWFRD